ALQQLVLVRIVARVERGLALMETVERRRGEEEAARGHQLRHLAEEEGHQQRGDMRAIHIGVGHDDDALVAQLLLAVALSRAADQRQQEVSDLLVLPQLVGARRSNIEDLAAQRQDRLRLAIARLLRRAAGAVALDEEDLGTAGRAAAAIGELAGEAELARRALAVEILLLPPPLALFGALDYPIEQHARRFGIARKPMVEMILERSLDEPCRFRRGEALLGLALELRLLDEKRQQDHRTGHHILGGDLPGAAVAGELAIGLEAAGQPGAQPRLMRAPVGCRDGVAVEGLERFLVFGPGNRPFDAATFAELMLAVEGLGSKGVAALKQ